MRILKALGGAAVLALLMAIVGAGSASAVALCKEEGKGPCPSEKTYPAETVITGTLEGKFEGSDEEEFTVSCLESEWEAETTAASGEKSVPGILESFMVAECTSNLGACNIEILNRPWAQDLDNMGNVGWSNLANGSPAIRVVCLWGLSHCRYGVNVLLGTMAPGNPAVVNVNQTLPLQADPPGGNSWGCGANFTWVAAFNLLPAPMFVR